MISGWMSGSTSRMLLAYFKDTEIDMKMMVDDIRVYRGSSYLYEYDDDNHNDRNEYLGWR